MTETGSLGDMSRRDLALQFRADPTIDADDDDISLSTIPANSPAMRHLVRDLRAARLEAAEGSPLRELLTRITRGEIDLRAALNDPAMPAPDADSLNGDVKLFLEEREEKEADQ